MAGNQDDYHRFVEQKHFLGEIEQGIRRANRKIIGECIPSFDKESILGFAMAVGQLRGRYLEAAFKLAVTENGDAPDQADIHELRTRREMFEEARNAFEALREAIEKGYVDVGRIGG